MIIKHPERLTKLEIWTPRYSDAYTGGERVVLVADYKLQNASPVVLIEFTKAKHLIGQRFCITRDDALGCPLDSNGKIPCRAIAMSKLREWSTEAEVAQIANTIVFEN